MGRNGKKWEEMEIGAIGYQNISEHGPSLKLRLGSHKPEPFAEASRPGGKGKAPVAGGNFPSDSACHEIIFFWVGLDVHLR